MHWAPIAATTRLRRWAIPCWPISIALAVLARSSAAQGPTTAAISGRITDSSGRGLSLAEIVVTNRSTGARVRAGSHPTGRYGIGGLEVGGPYSVTVRRIGSQVSERHGLYLTLGQQLRLDIAMVERPLTLAAVETRAAPSRALDRARMGTETLFSGATIATMPLLNRDLYDLVRLVPQMSTRFGLGAPGTNGQQNSIRIDGASEQGIAGNLPGGAAYGGKSIPLDAVKEYQVLLTPFDVRQGNFSGATINAVTRSGTNELWASAFVYGTNERLGPGVPFIRDARYRKEQFGLSVGGPIVRDRLHFFVAAELQQRLIPAIGPYVGQDAASETPLPVAASDVARFQQLLVGLGVPGGSADAVNNRNPAANLFLRLDAPVPAWNSRVVVRGNFSQADSQVFARPTPNPNSNCPSSACFPLSSVRATRALRKTSIVSQLYTNFASGAYNEAIVAWMDIPGSIAATTRQPLVLVTTPGLDGQTAQLQSGAPELSSDSTALTTIELTDNLTFPLGSHRVTAGVSAQRFGIRRFDLRGAFGVWEFGSLDALEAGAPSRYRLARDFGAARRSLWGTQSAVYLGDDWDATSRLSLTFGMRAELPTISGSPPRVVGMETLLPRSTDRVPSSRIQWSPRLGFRYAAQGGETRSTVVRGGVGAFTGRPPVAWLFGPFGNAGLPVGSLQCGSLATDAGPAPPFVANAADAPLTCANGKGFSTRIPAEVDVFAPELRYPQAIRGTLAIERELGLGLVGSVEALFTRTLHAMFFTPANLASATAVDRHGRTLYGSIGASGLAAPKRITSAFNDVILVGNQSKDYAVDLTAELRKTFSTAGEMQLSFTYARDRDVQSQRLARPVLIDNWRYGRPVAGDQRDLSLGISDYDIPFRLRASGTVHTPSPRWRTDVSMYYIGGSGLPFTYVAGGAQGRGDLNADGGIGNDPIYIPRSASDTAEIRFAGTAGEVAAQQEAFDEFVDGDMCLRGQRGGIMRRNSCRAPWSHLVNVGLRQALPFVNEHALSFEVQVFNFLNLLNARWGQVALPTLAAPATTSQVALLSHVGQTAGAPESAQPIYRFDPTTRRYSRQNFESYYQIQFAVRYTVGR